LRKGLLVLVVALVLPAQAAAQGATREVSVGDDSFTPEIISLDAGAGSVHWAWNTVNQHNVREDNRLFYSGTISTTGDFTITPSAGGFNYFCELHGFGMGGFIKVKPTGTVKGKKATIVWATSATDTGTQFDVRQKVGSKKPELVEQKTRELQGTFKLKPGKNQFQVRSRQGKATSDWSPKLNLKG
jgi:plastocyanin